MFFVVVVRKRFPETFFKSYGVYQKSPLGNKKSRNCDHLSWYPGDPENGPKPGLTSTTGIFLVGLALGLQKSTHHLGSNAFCNQFFHSIISFFLYIIFYPLYHLLSYLILLMLFSLFLIHSFIIWPMNQSHTRNNMATTVLYSSLEGRLMLRFKGLQRRRVLGYQI